MLNSVLFFKPWRTIRFWFIFWTLLMLNKLVSSTRPPFGFLYTLNWIPYIRSIVRLFVSACLLSDKPYMYRWAIGQLEYFGEIKKRIRGNTKAKLNYRLVKMRINSHLSCFMILSVLNCASMAVGNVKLSFQFLPRLSLRWLPYRLVSLLMINAL